MKWFTVLFLSFISFSLWAGDAAKLNFIGFSDAGNYLAYQQYWISDGEGAAYVELHIINVEKNRSVVAPIKHNHQDDRQLSVLRQQNIKAAETQLKQYNIKTNNKGDLLVSKRFNDMGANDKQARFSIGTPLANMPNIKYTLNLEEKGSRISCGDAGNAKMFDLTLLNEGTKQTKTLQKDRSLPQDRGCPIRYRIQDVYAYHEEFIVVFLNVFQAGFEGDNMRYMVVTGTLN
jgi:predicted secreted protein